MKAPVIRNGAKGIELPIFFFLKKTSATPIIAPIEKASINARRIFGQPKTIPKRITNCASPNPIHFSLEIHDALAKPALSAMRLIGLLLSDRVNA